MNLRDKIYNWDRQRHHTASGTTCPCMYPIGKIYSCTPEMQNRELFLIYP